MNSTRWLQHFRHNAQHRPEPDWSLPSPEVPGTRRLLARSLAHFQLGETGEGEALLRFARDCPDTAHDPDHESALTGWMNEEQGHVRLLGKLVGHLGGEPVPHHWTQFLFRHARRALGFRFELQSILICELIGTAWFRCVRDHTLDHVVRQACLLILRDEAGHVAYHAERFREHMARLLPWERAVWQTQFQLLFHLAAGICWLDHQRCLRALGVARLTFQQSVRGEVIRFLDRITPVAKPRWRLRPASFPTP